MTSSNHRIEPRYEVDLAKATETWHRAPEVSRTVEDLFSTRIAVPIKDELVLPTHYDTNRGITPICYDDAQGAEQEDIVRYFRPGEVFICVKHHQVEHPNLQANSEAEAKEAVKFNATHVSVGVGVHVRGADGEIRPGAITVNNPQDYLNGLFGNPHYPMIFLRLRFPELTSPPADSAEAAVPEEKAPLTPGGPPLPLADEERLAYMDNIRTWLVIANTYTHFPGDYNGGDPLATRSVSAVRVLGYRLLDALAGTGREYHAALEWLEAAENKVYCAELAHVAVNLGIHCPLNEAFLGERFPAVRQALGSGGFLASNRNSRVRFVQRTMAPESLRPLSERIGITPTEPAPGQPFGDGLALRPMTMASMVEAFVQLVPREELGERVAAIQVEMFRRSRPGLIEQIALDQLDPSDPRRQAAESLLDDLEGCIGTEAADYAEFRDRLDPLIARAETMAGPRPDGSGAFMPPHAWLLHALGKLSNEGGLMGLEIAGHGFHADLLRPVIA